MEPGDIPEDVLRFIQNEIDTVPHLETLLLLWESASRAWSPEEVAVRTYVPRERAEAILDDLARRRLVRPEPDISGLYRYDSDWDPTGDVMANVASTYRRQLIRVANIIHDKASLAVRDFARAFQFKKER